MLPFARTGAGEHTGWVEEVGQMDLTVAMGAVRRCPPVLPAGR